MNRTYERSESLTSPPELGPAVGWDPYEVWFTRVRAQRMKEDRMATLWGPTDRRAVPPAKEKLP